ncbi:MAG: helicase-exonuclease AddAB subunit AddA [Clostridium baratii]|uniref:ATP-dependent helicase/nuclease subunit A n=1 Tax=Clostridium baratii str. Sullivan TaxID=1415775 RepID=A0A0A7FTM2_9CLOT|nr:helicase-exonuclease AddAB subunit AddA [Clostridium baratii]AIY82957.1 helicase-exonuclease AddAB, AddA subunit [Clostridium baratii str. Sullivan]MBS6007749.1 helicase-exonuclease AddAB subunit AddA [Clostridium baratii]MDU1054542.1 helicase-exonuclease AddAB subunit AddA [Clostridium baratii]
MGETKWTKEQRKAIDTRRCNLLVAAAAGSGKTAVLVERIIKIVTDEKNPVDIDKLLVVTFTSAAAAEMRERIAAAITKALERNPSSKILQRQLTLLSRANITTMHSFCLDVIKNNFHTIDLDPAFRIGDETEGTLLKNEILDEMFEDYYEKDDMEFFNLVEAYSGSKDDEKLKEMVLDLYRFSMSGPWPEKWLTEKAEEFNISSLEELDKTVWVEVLKNDINMEVDSFINLYYKAIEMINDTEGIEEYLDTFNDELSRIINLKESLDLGLSEIYDKLFKISFGRLKSIRKNKVSDVDAQNLVKSIRDEVKKKICKLQDDIFMLSPTEMLEGINLTYPFMKKLSEITLEFSKRFSERKKEKNMLDFNDLEHLCLKILIDKTEEGDIVPSKISENFRELFDEVLVDEYQDSNNVQEAIINLVSRKNTDNPNVFMVGDVKQSIYRFRQAKPELFLEKYNTYSRNDEGKNKVIQLYKNFRSREEVINAVNYIFKEVMSLNVGELEYTEDEALNLGANFKELNEEGAYKGGEVELHVLDKNITSENEDEDEEDIDSINLEARVVARRINELMSQANEEKFRVLDKETGEYRPLKYKDIVILLRATKNWSEIFLDELGLSGIPVYADTGSGYFESIEIRTIMSLLKIIDNPLQDVPMIAVLKAPFARFNAEELADIRMIDKSKYFYENILEIVNEDIEVSGELKKKCSIFIENLNKWRDKSVYTPIDEFIWYLYMDTSYYGYVGAMPNGVLRQANLKILFQRAKQYEETSFKGLFNFINFINKLRKSSGDMGSAKILGENEDVVRIMSIHKSKGLEFPVVFLSGAGKQFNLMDLNNRILHHDDLGFGPDYIDLDKRISYSTLPKEAIKKKIRLETLSEEMRILYVAFTRAKEKLIITGATRDIDKTVEKWVQAASVEKSKISPAEVLKGKSYLDWIGMALCQHKDGEPLRGRIGVSSGIAKDDLSTWKVNLWDSSNLFVEKNLDAVDEISIDEELFINSRAETVDKEIARRLGYEYKYLDSTTIKSNISVSDLKKAGYEPSDEYRGESLFKEKPVLKPRFLQEKKGLSGAERGTAMHFVMQKIDYDRVDSLENIKMQLEEMLQNELLTKDEFKAINPYKIYNFFKSDLGKNILKVYNEGGIIHRELPFFTRISASKVKEDISKESYNEEVRLQGVIDLFFELDGEIILVDYKTDYVKDNIEEEMNRRYKIQLDYYSDAIKKITGKVVNKRYLYLFYIDKEIEL